MATTTPQDSLAHQVSTAPSVTAPPLDQTGNYTTQLDKLLTDTGSLAQHSTPSESPTSTTTLDPVFDFLIRPDRLAINPSFAEALIRHNEIENDEHLIEIVHGFTTKEALHFLDAQFSLDAYRQMKSSMINLVLFGQYLESTYRIDAVPPLDELRWRTVRRKMDQLNTSVTADIVYLYDWHIRNPASWVRENSFTDTLPSPISHPRDTYTTRHPTTPPIPPTFANPGIPPPVPPTPQYPPNPQPSTLPRSNLGSSNSSGFRGGSPLQPSQQHNVNTINTRRSSLIQQHFRTPGSQLDEHSATGNSRADAPVKTTTKLVKRTGFDASKIKWNGQLDSFPPVEAALRAYCMISQMGYIVRPQFLHEYKRHYQKVDLTSQRSTNDTGTTTDNHSK